MPEVKRKGPGVREITLAVNGNTDFRELVGVLEKCLTLKDLPGIKGCAPCLSGLDRLVIGDVVLPSIR
jgi:hypothetical protein